MANGFIGLAQGKFNIRYRFDGLDEVITNPGNFINPQTRFGRYIWPMTRNILLNSVMHQLQGSYFVNSDFNIQLQSSYTDYSRQVFSTTVSKNTGDVRLNTADGAQSVVDFTGFTFRTTALYKLSKLFLFNPD